MRAALGSSRSPHSRFLVFNRRHTRPPPALSSILTTMDFVVAAVQVPRALAAAALGLGLFSAFFNVREEKETVWEEQFGTTHPAHALRPFPLNSPRF